MSIKEVLDQQFKISKKANNEWKYEFRRQENLLKKQVVLNVTGKLQRGIREKRKS